MAIQPVTGDAFETSPPNADAGADAASRKGVYHFLDVGAKPYGDCIVVEFGNVRILIDGSHLEDYKGQKNVVPIPDQLDAIFGTPRPHRFDLIVVTHGHQDHIGCLPSLLSNAVISADFALLTDPKLGFGRTVGEESPTADSMTPADALAVLLREEDASFLTDAELAEFIDDAITVEERYARFIADLQSAGTKITFHRGGPLDGELAERLKPTGAELLGPSLDQLLRCAEQIANSNEDAQDLVADRSMDGVGDLIQLYRAVAVDDKSSGGGRGNGMNCQSITFAFGPPGERVLLGGDMQFSEPGVRGADAEVSALRAKVVAAGPYTLFKTTHHTSHNGQDELFLRELGRPPLLVHSGGSRDVSHPYPSTLKMLARQGEILFARTDRNGLITVRPDRKTESAFKISRGELNDFTPNVVSDTPLELETMTHGTSVAEPSVAAISAEAMHNGPQIIIVNLPPGPVDMTVAGVDIVVRGGGSVGARVSAAEAKSAPAAARPTGDPGQQRFEALLFVTDADRLRRNIGRAEADQVLDEVRRFGGELVDGPGPSLAATVAGRLRSAEQPRGVVILGGYDVVPPRRLDVLGPTLRPRLKPADIRNDGDQFVIWSDATYGDDDGDGIADVPVSRIPDGRDPRLVATALASHPPVLRQRFGIRNVARPFAEAVFETVTGDALLKSSRPLVSREVMPQQMTGESHYLMLHGAHDDARAFEGESLDGSPPPIAFEIGLVPRRFEGVIFTGCCWGAMPVDRRAMDEGDPAPRLAEDSIAMAYLKAGANAFIGCTGSHYSGPSTDPDANFAARLHTAFWAALKGGGSPAAALFAARNTYMEEMLVRRFTPLDTARRLKNFAQFTCLGLGW